MRIESRLTEGKVPTEVTGAEAYAPQPNVINGCSDLLLPVEIEAELEFD